MSETPQDAWFYTIEGEKCGPVTLADLRVKAHEGGLNPRLDMVWCVGMADWKPAGEIDGLFERRTNQEVKENLSSTADPYQPPQESMDDPMRGSEDWPGARRRSYLIATILFPVVWPFAISMCSPFFMQQLGSHITGVIVMAATFLPLVVAIWYGLARLTNLGMSRWWFFGNFVPFLNLWVGYRCFACPAGYAYYKKLDGAGIVLAIIYWLLLVVSILMIVAFIALLLGIVGDPAIQEEMRQILRIIEERTAKP